EILRSLSRPDLYDWEIYKDIAHLLFRCCCVRNRADRNIARSEPILTGRAPPPANQAYEHVASQLDPNGSIFIYWNTETLLGEIDNSLQAVKASALADANLTASQLAKFEAGFDLVRHILL